MALTAVKIKNLRLNSGQSSRKVADSGGLYILLRKNSKLWRMKYRFNGKEQSLSFGAWPTISLADAREMREQAKKLIRKGINPSQIKAERKEAAKAWADANKEQKDIDANTFEVVAILWMKVQEKKISHTTLKKNKRRLEMYVFPFIGSIPITKIKTKLMVDVVLKVSKRGSVETAKRTGILCSSIMKHACSLGLIDAVPYLDLKNILPVVTTKNMPAMLDPKEIGALLRAIDDYDCDFIRASPITALALKLLPYVFVRAGEFRGAKWSEIDFKQSIWTIPAVARKLVKHKKENPDNVHIVPLSRQAIVILRELQQRTGDGIHIFPSIRGDSRPMCENTINNALHRMGFKGKMVGHGWRTVFSTVMNKHNFNADSIEQQLSHVDKNAVRAAYARGDYRLEDRIIIMQTWANYLDGLRSGAVITPIGRSH